jgi:hypothetical protein
MITDEIRDNQDRLITDTEQLTRDRSSSFKKWHLWIPKRIRRWYIKRMIDNPFKMKKLIGTIGITSLGMFIKGQGAFILPFGDKTLNLGLGGIKEQAVVRNGKAENRKYLCVTFMINHDIVDGAPGIRCATKVAEQLGLTTYLDDLDKI